MTVVCQRNLERVFPKNKKRGKNNGGGASWDLVELLPSRRIEVYRPEKEYSGWDEI